MTTRLLNSKTGGYTLVEVLIAAGLLGLAVAAAASLALAMASQEQQNARVARAINQQEQAVRLYQMGVDPTTILALLPPDRNVVSISFDSSTLAVSGVGNLEKAICRMTFDVNEVLDDGSRSILASTNAAPLRTNNIVALRPSIR